VGRQNYCSFGLGLSAARQNGYNSNVQASQSVHLHFARLVFNHHGNELEHKTKTHKVTLRIVHTATFQQLAPPLVKVAHENFE
jgi:hypothetical protein